MRSVSSTGCVHAGWSWLHLGTPDGPSCNRGCHPPGAWKGVGARRLPGQYGGSDECHLPRGRSDRGGLDQARLDSIGRHFDRYVASRKIPGFLAVVTRKGRVAYVGRGGFRDLEIEAPIETDTRFRIYSMTKPLTSVAAMICYEEGSIALDDPLSKFIPEFGETRVFAGGSSLRPVTVPMSEPIRIWASMTHTAGLTYGWMFSHPVDAMYRAAGFEWAPPPSLDLAGCCSRLAQIPLRCQPGTEWNYSMATDVLAAWWRSAPGSRSRISSNVLSSSHSG